MKLLFPLILLLSVRCFKGQQRMRIYQPIVLRFEFDSFYNSWNKHCCKLSPGHCYTLFNSAGLTFFSLKERVLITKGDSWIEFKISNVQDQDAGYYRCLVTGVPQLYQDYWVTLSEVSDGRIQRQPSVTPAVRTSAATLPHSTSGVLGEDFTEDRRASWSSGRPFIITVSITAMLLITSILCVIFCRFKARKSDKCAEVQHNILEQEAGDKHCLQQETSGIIYTTVDFRAHQEQGKMHENPRMPKTQAQKDDCSKDGKVEYSALAYHRQSQVKVSY